ncbi:hypothetical protein EXIGLDRAFT_707215 [Exidia glandulosa HHB12029]|uniref:Uncharacterized protein n=1 Tax=Exidia glandulosa HHB12029 TaxID=1314781 RepID=A0A165JY93_EXIGL|nr:hypothetical protein EXIGLDRAFT_707215 [Exidia glandulosa HHB12029]
MCIGVVAIAVNEVLLPITVRLCTFQDLLQSVPAAGPEGAECALTPATTTEQLVARILVWNSIERRQITHSHAQSSSWPPSTAPDFDSALFLAFNMSHAAALVTNAALFSSPDSQYSHLDLRVGAAPTTMYNNTERKWLHIVPESNFWSPGSHSHLLCLLTLVACSTSSSRPLPLKKFSTAYPVVVPLPGVTVETAPPCRRPPRCRGSTSLFGSAEIARWKVDCCITFTHHFVHLFGTASHAALSRSSPHSLTARLTLEFGAFRNTASCYLVQPFLTAKFGHSHGDTWSLNYYVQQYRKRLHIVPLSTSGLRDATRRCLSAISKLNSKGPMSDALSMRLSHAIFSSRHGGCHQRGARTSY